MGKPSRKPDATPEGSPLSLDAIMAEHQAAIRRYVERRGFRGADRDDMVQEIFHGAARSLSRFDPSLGTMRGWLLRIAFNLISKERQRAHRRHEELWPEEALDGLSSDAPDSETRLIEAQRGDILAELLLEVPPTRREILVAHDIEEEAVQDIAEERAMPRSTAWNHLRLARLSLGAAARRWRARNRGRGALLAPLAVALGAGEARASPGPLHGDSLRRLLGWARRALGRAPSRGDAGLAASSRRASRVATRAVGRSVAHTAAGVAAGALVLFAAGGTVDVATPPAEAITLSPLQLPAAVPRGPAVPWAPALPPDLRAAGTAGGGFRATGHSASRPRRAPAPLQGHDALSRVEDRLWRAAIATLTSGGGDAARQLLEQHRRAFPRGVYAGDREELLGRLPASARPE
ncbi:sigma-70 family RNA polymerase sigma factor [Sorangium sp. So ce1389]|uniref:RNA polymerase sigma factor n=1 Tax=Sorangium sp. So ce1389 TaxID=3133336 RepID=UPI003F5D83EB